MAFYGCEFSFNGQSCRDYGLMLYDVGSYSQGDTDFSVGELSEERINSRYDPLVYGVVHNEPLTFSLVFGANVESVDEEEPLDRIEIGMITKWLTGQNGYRYLEIHQPDMYDFRYKCVISELKLATFGNMPWAFSCTVTCDSPFAYLYPETYEYTVNGTSTISLLNRSGYGGYYKPIVTITTNSGGNVLITNASDSNRVFKFTSLPSQNGLVTTVDNLNQIITSNGSFNMYSFFNMNFLRLVPGVNNLTLSGNCTIEIKCEFPVNIGG